MRRCTVAANCRVAAVLRSGLPPACRQVSKKRGGEGERMEAANPYIKKQKDSAFGVRLGFITVGCGLGGFLIGQYVDYDPRGNIIPMFNRNDIRIMLKRQFETRPDLAQLALRLVFVTAALREGQIYDIKESCGAADGLKDILDLIHTIEQMHEISHADCVALVGTYALEFLGGPKIPEYWGRLDKDPDGQVKPKGEPCPYTSIQKSLGVFGLSTEEAVALMGAHTVGETHSYTYGMDAARTETPFRFNNEYYQRLLTGQRQEVVDAKSGMTYIRDKRTAKKFTHIFTKVDLDLAAEKNFQMHLRTFAENEGKWRQVFAEAFEKLMNHKVHGKLKPFVEGVTKDSAGQPNTTLAS